MSKPPPVVMLLNQGDHSKEVPKKKTKTKTVKFGLSQKRKEVVAVSAPVEALFLKEQVVVPKKAGSVVGPGSLLTKGLLESGVLNNSRTTKTPRGGVQGLTVMAPSSVPTGSGGLDPALGGGSDQGQSGTSGDLPYTPTARGAREPNLTVTVTQATQATGDPAGIPHTPQAPAVPITPSSLPPLVLKVFVEGGNKIKLKIEGSPTKVGDVIQLALEQFLVQQAAESGVSGGGKVPEKDDISGRISSRSVSKSVAGGDEEEMVFNLPPQAY